MKPNLRTNLAFAHDLAASALAWWFAYLLRFNFDIPPQFMHEVQHTLLWVVPLQTCIFWLFGLYKGVWRYASLPDFKRILKGVIVAILVTAAVALLFRLDIVLPRSVLVLDLLLLLVMMGGSRVAYRVWKEHRLHGLIANQGEPVLVLGAGEAAVTLIKELARSHQWRPVGLLDDDATKHGRMLHGIKVLSALDGLPRWAEQYSIKQVIIALPSASHQTRRRAFELCRDSGLQVFTVPAFDDLISGRVTVSQIRKVEVDDLLGREPVVLDSHGLQEFIHGRTVMVTGAGGSIGAELCRQIAKFGPGRLIFFELSEFALYNLEQEFARNFAHLRIVCAVGDVKNRQRLDEMMEKYQPAVLFHAAAYKHVPLMETDNAWEAVRNNVLGTMTCAEAAIAHGVEKFVLISTDKAVNPVNVMGATKRLAELVCQALHTQGKTKFVVVRFGNVLGSAGSVIPKFHEQIARGGPVTVTHPDMIRYFMSIPEAAQLVLQAGMMGEGGEIFVLDMGEPVKIVDLAREMIRLSGFSEDDIRIVFTGLRPGEKLYEELLADDEHTLPTPHNKLRIAKAAPAGSALLDGLRQWCVANKFDSDADIRAQLKAWVPEYLPANNGELALRQK